MNNNLILDSNELEEFNYTLRSKEYQWGNFYAVNIQIDLVDVGNFTEHQNFIRLTNLLSIRTNVVDYEWCVLFSCI